MLQLKHPNVAGVVEIIALAREHSEARRPVRASILSDSHRKASLAPNITHYKALGEMITNQIQENHTLLRVVLFADDREDTADSIARGYLYNAFDLWLWSVYFSQSFFERSKLEEGENGLDREVVRHQSRWRRRLGRGHDFRGDRDSSRGCPRGARAERTELSPALAARRAGTFLRLPARDEVSSTYARNTRGESGFRVSIGRRRKRKILESRRRSAAWLRWTGRRWHFWRIRHRSFFHRWTFGGNNMGEP
jgi:hypothetical protein